MTVLLEYIDSFLNYSAHVIAYLNKTTELAYFFSIMVGIMITAVDVWVGLIGARVGVAASAEITT